MSFGLKDYLFFGALVLLVMMVVLWGYQKHRADTLEERGKREQAIGYQERIQREYIPNQLEKKSTDELSTMGGVLWGE